MKKRMYLFIALFAGASGLYAQDCAKGYCPSTIVVHHKIGDLSAETKDITYNVVKITTTASPTCWITQNLGAQNTPTDVRNSGTSYNGWQYQAGHKQGNVTGTYTNFVTSTTGAAGDSWNASEDPCTLSLGAAWHVPSRADYIAAVSGGWGAIKVNSAPAYYYTAGSWAVYYNSGAISGYHVQDYGRDSSYIWVVWDNGQTAGSLVSAYFLIGYCVSQPVRCVKLVSQ